MLLEKKPLYRIPESCLHWYLTYLEYHLGELGMVPACGDPSVFIKSTNERLEGTVDPQVDDSLSLDTEQFMEDYQRASKMFKRNPRQTLHGLTIVLNVLTIKHKGNGILMHHPGKLNASNTQYPSINLRAYAHFFST